MKTRMAGLFLIAAIATAVASGAVSDPIRAVYDKLSPQAKALYYKQSHQLTRPVPQRLVELDQLTIACFAPAAIKRMSANDTHLGGQCCGTLMDIETYEVQLKALHRFIATHGNIALIPRDPYDVSVPHAQRLIALDESVKLAAAQQAIYDQAVKKSHHGGPCCCRCWKWYTMAGLGKKLVADHGWTVAQVAELWDTSSSCGHAHDTDMHKHYNVPADHGPKHHEHPST